MQHLFFAVRTEGAIAILVPTTRIILGFVQRARKIYSDKKKQL